MTGRRKKHLSVSHAQTGFKHTTPVKPPLTVGSSRMGFKEVGLLLQCYLTLAAAMYFDLGEREQKCIIEEIPEDTLVTGESLTLLF